MNQKILLTIFLLLVPIFRFGSSQQFDEKFEHWPIDLRINGTIIILNRVTDVPTVRKIVQPVITDKSERAGKGKDGKPSAPVILTDNTDRTRDRGILKDWSLPSTTQILETSNAGPAMFQKIASTGVIILDTQSSDAFGNSAGPFSDALKKTIQAGGTVITVDQAAAALSSRMITGRDLVPDVGPGLGLVPDSVIDPGFRNQTDANRILSVLAAYPRLVGIGVPHGTCLILRGRKFFTRETGEATFLLAANDRQPRRVHRIGVKIPRKDRLDFENNLLDLTEWRRDAIDRTLPEFPPAKPRPPIVPNGTLIIVGGGGMPQGLMERMVEMAGGKNAEMVYIPCSEREDVGARHFIVEQWKRMGVRSATVLHTKDRIRANSDEEFLKPLKTATGIWFGGGRQWNFSDSWYGTRGHRLMKEVLKRGGVIGGSSAGASIQARYLARATPIANFRIMAPGYERGGLGFISGVAIDQHFSQRGRQKDMTALIARYPQLLGIGIDETTAIIVQKSIARVVGKGKVHFYDANRPVYPDQPDYIALSAGSSFDLVKREVLIEAEEKKPGTAKEKAADKVEKAPSGKN